MDDIGLKNYMEDIVKDVMPRILKSMDVCTCNRCYYDIMAQVLNKMPPKYIVTQKGQLYTKLSNLIAQFNVDIVAAVTNAAEVVKKNPRHDD